jgi:hypothetical protein
VPTKMGGPSAPDDLYAGAETQVWLATSDDHEAMVSGEYFYHQKRRAAEAEARDEKIQEQLIAACARISAYRFPTNSVRKRTAAGSRQCRDSFKARMT